MDSRKMRPFLSERHERMTICIVWLRISYLRFGMFCVWQSNGVHWTLYRILKFIHVHRSMEHLLSFIAIVSIGVSSFCRALNHQPPCQCHLDNSVNFIGLALRASLHTCECRSTKTYDACRTCADNLFTSSSSFSYIQSVVPSIVTLANPKNIESQSIRIVLVVFGR